MLPSERWTRAADLLCANRDVLDERPAQGRAPDALVERAWVTALDALDDHALEDLEIGGLDAPWPSSTPRSLVALVEESRAICTLSSLGSRLGRSSPAPSARVRETPRKRTQVDAFVDAVTPLARASRRVLDVGAGHGHLTRALADRVGRHVVGLERDPELTRRARTLSTDAKATFAVTDVLGEGLPVERDDCLVGLHACGALGDTMVDAAARAGASLALVACCPQKQSTSARRAFVRTRGEALDFPTRLLGLGNLTARADGVEASRRANLAARERRLALHRLLEDARGPLRFGAEMDGLNRRAAHADLPTLVARAFARRGATPPSAAEVERAATWARVQHARVRRLSLPRSMLARVIEVFVLVDRAAHLEAHGRTVQIGTLFPPDVSARNLLLLAS